MQQPSASMPVNSSAFGLWPYPNGELNRHRRIRPRDFSPGAAYIALGGPDLYEVVQAPKIALGRRPVLVHILAPYMRAVQIAQDLGSFCREQYPKMKQELQGKYPKHVWRCALS